MRKGIMKGLLAVMVALGIGVFAGNASLYQVSAEENQAEETQTEERSELHQELVMDPLSVLDDVIPTGVQTMCPQEIKEQFRGCVCSVGGVAGGVALGAAAIALLKKKKD